MIKYFLPIVFLVSLTQTNLAQRISYMPGEILIALEPGETPRKILNEYSNYRGVETDIKIQQVIAEPMNIWCISVDPTTVNLNDFGESINNRKEVRLSQKNYKSTYRRIPNDPNFGRQWQYINDGINGGVSNIDTDIERAWDITTGGLTTNGDTIVVCVIDDGMDDNHEEFKDNLWVNHQEIPDNNMDDDNNGYVDDIYGWDSIEDDGNVFREGNHGTSVAGIIGAKGNNNIGVTGVNWDVKVMNVRGGTNASNAIKAYSYPYNLRKKYNETQGQEGAFVVATNASWGFEQQFEFDAPIFCEFYDLLGEVGILNASATTNQERNVDEEGDLPSRCASPYLIVVTNLRSDGMRESSGYGNLSVDLAAPGEDTYTTGKPNNYRTFCCTSAASPHVAGTIGLIYATDCDYLAVLAQDNPADAALLAKNLVIGGVMPNENMKGISVTEGHLNIGNTIELAQDLCNDCVFPQKPDYIAQGQSLVISWKRPNQASSVSLRFRLRGSDSWSTMTNLDDMVTLNNLNSCEVYEVQLKSNCSSQGVYGPSYFIQTDNCCQTPSNVITSINGNDLKISWDAVNAADSYTISYRDLLETDFTTENITKNELIITGVSSCSGFDYQIGSNCGVEMTKFTPLQQIAINCDACQEQNYCGDVFMDNEFEWIETVILGNSVFTSGFDLAGYGNFVGSPIQNLSQGNTVEMDIIPGFSDGAYTEYTKVFIDWNQDGDFSEDELVLKPEPASDTLSGTISVPESALPGNTRMRVILSFDDFNTPCKDFTLEYGEIEDYCVNIQSVGNCNDDLSIDDFITTKNSIVLLWTEISDVISYDLEYRLLGESDFSVINIDLPTATIYDLSDCSTYEIKVSSNCGSNGGRTSSLRTINTRCGTSITNPENDIEITKIFPNPIFDFLQIKISGRTNAKEMAIQLFDMNGKELRKEIISIQQGVFTLSGLADLPAGVIIIKSQIGKVIMFNKIVKI